MIGCRNRVPLLLVLGLGLTLLAVPCLAEKHVLPELDETSGIGDYLEYAALNNPGLEAAFLEWQAALEAADAAGTLPDPRFSYGFFIREVETRVGPQRHRLGVAQRFPWIGTLQTRKDQAARTAEARHLDYEARKLDLFGRVKRAFHEYGYLARAIEITGENVQLLTFFERVARARYKVGSANHADIIKAQVELGRLEERIGVDRSAKLSGAVDIDATAEVEISIRLDLPQMRTLLQRKTLKLRIPDAEREGHDIDVQIVYAGKLAGI